MCVGDEAGTTGLCAIVPRYFFLWPLLVILTPLHHFLPLSFPTFMLTPLLSFLSLSPLPPQSASEVTAVAESQSKELREAQAALQQVQERCAALQGNLDSAFKEIEQLGRDKADAEARARQAETAAQEGMQENVAAAHARHAQELAEISEEHEAKIEDIRGALKRAETQAQRREKSLREELAAMQQRVHDAEERGQELSASMSQATRPLLRQIASLQEAAAAQQESWEVSGVVDERGVGGCVCVMDG